MTESSEILSPLVELTRTLGQPHLDYVIIGEGNTSCRIDDDSFWIKASGQQMNGISAEGFTAVRFTPILAMLDESPGDLAAQKQVMEAAKVDPAMRLPSVEVSFHAMLLAETGVKYIGHTHPVAVNRLMCSTRAEQFAKNRMFPDEAVLCGPESVFVPYGDPGLPLALTIRDQTRAYLDQYGEAPKVILLANHGLITLGQTTAEILNITAMCVKAAHIFAGACAVGEPVFMSPEDIAHIYKRPDEIYRRKQFVEK
ncbi:MAG TPA: class II aldolase/adducin family protein [Phototrophicaceae bacterium]|jgi:rhamnose utilization protein RhaD (predicted bifunctional aldolase and dehydrogenase)|nr:class II aldolase/adducin family protein [Phototrophicaceae bacterium]